MSQGIRSLPAEGTGGPDPVAEAGRIGREVLAAYAEEVDADSRFPREAIDALRDAGLLRALIPLEQGGLGLDVDTVARVTNQLGRYCSSAAMVYAMHQIQVACLVEHGSPGPVDDFTRRVAREGLLLASATTEVGTGGDVRSSNCAVEPAGEDADGSGQVSLRKQAPVISYGADADAVLATARRTPESPPGDQVLVVCAPGTYTLEETSGWDALGFRGTCSRGYRLAMRGPAALVLPDPYADISTRTMLPVAHVLWASLWLGIAEAAETKARTFVQAAARRTPGNPPPSALRLAELTVVLQQLRATVTQARERYAATRAQPELADTTSYAITMNTLKVTASTLMVDVVSRALLVCGMAGYANRSPFTLGRLLRDAYGAQLMVNNDRILGNTSSMLLAYRGQG